MIFETNTNPDGLTKRQIHDLIKVCPVCSTPWPKGEGKCTNKECGVKVRVEPKSLNWWMFYPRCNGWGHLAHEIEDDHGRTPNDLHLRCDME